QSPFRCAASAGRRAAVAGEALAALARYGRAGQRAAKAPTHAAVTRLAACNMGSAVGSGTSWPVAPRTGFVVLRRGGYAPGAASISVTGRVQLAPDHLGRWSRRPHGRH